jgi:hypothetical protein
MTASLEWLKLQDYAVTRDSIPKIGKILTKSGRVVTLFTNRLWNLDNPDVNAVIRHRLRENN